MSETERSEEEALVFGALDRRKKLNNNESAVARRLLARSLSDSKDMVRGMDLFLRLPPDIACDGFLDAWENSAGNHSALQKTLVAHQGLTGHVGHRRKLRLAVRASERFPDLAFAVFRDMSVPGMKGDLSDNVLSELTDFAQASCPVLKPLFGPHRSPSETGAVLTLLVSAGLAGEGGASEWLEWVADVATEAGVKLPIKGRFSKRLRDRCKNLPEQVQRKCAKAGLTSVITTRLGPTDEYDGQSHSGRGLPPKSSRADATVPASAHWSPCSDRIQVRMSTVKREFGALEAEADRLCRELAETKSQLDADRAELRSAQHEIGRLAEVLSRTETRAEDLARQRILLEDAITEMKQAHSLELSRASEELEREESRVLSEFRNILAQALQSDHEEFLVSESVPLSERQGDFLRRLMRRLWKTLAEHDIKVGGKSQL